ncbi:MAG: hypothetical protein AB7I50_19115 [Vicinamibacterales bacterium]
MRVKSHALLVLTLVVVAVLEVSVVRNDTPPMSGTLYSTTVPLMVTAPPVP